jgi:nicotinamide-nucleotide amidase
MMPQPLSALVQEVASLLQASNRRIVFAESCTGGLVSASLARVSGISEFLCGSAVVYRLDTKARWLGISEALLRDTGPVSEVVARAMALGVLACTPEADLAASVTGHLGPNAPDDQDGLVFIGIAHRRAETIGEAKVDVFECRLTSDGKELSKFPGNSIREQRQWLAVERVLSLLKAALASL